MVYIPTDLLLDILQRLPWTSRRRMRLVCRTWRNLVHQRTTEMRQCRDAVLLVVTTESTYLLDDLGSSETCRPRQLWPDDMDVYKNKEVVGVCNGVLCLCDDTKPGGAITLANPATGDVLELPPIPCAGLFRRHNTRRSGRSWHQAYSFGFHHGTGQYKVVHVPCFFKTKETLQVFTLGEATWREIPAPDAKCKLEAGVVSVNGATYWVTDTDRRERIKSFDLESEQVTYTKPLPNSIRARPICHLTEVQRRLSIAVATTGETPNGYYGRVPGGIEVWILERARKEETWVRQYILYSLPSPEPSIQLARPSFIHGKRALMVRSLAGENKKLFSYNIGPLHNYLSELSCTAVHVNSCYPNGSFRHVRGEVCRIFAYIETTEALSVHKRW